MKDHNKRVIQALNDYLKVEKPGYGILIKGDWGCGKSFIVKQWKKDVETGLSKEDSDDEDGEVITLKPIYVSLNGLGSANQIDEALKRSINPFLHGRFMKGLGKALKIVASVALRVNVDINGDGTPEHMVYTIDPKALLELDPTKVKGHRILIFDDIERADIPVEEVLGYINYYVEQVGCHVVMIGDVKKVKNEDSFKFIKEKTIGHEYRIEPETEEALDVFVKEIDKDGKLGLIDSKQLIEYCFRVSGISNLRILRQCLNDYRMYVAHLRKNVTGAEEFKTIKNYLLANFITVYAEYKSGNLLMEDFNKHLISESFALTAARHNTDKEPPKSTPATNTQAKYDSAGLMESHRVFKQGYIECVMNYLVNGEINEDFLLEEVKRDRSTPWERLGNYHSLSNQEFTECLNQTASYLQRGEFDGLDVLLLAACCLLTIIKRNLTYNYTSEKVIGWCSQHIEEKFFPACKTLDELYDLKTHAHRCLNYYNSESIVEECKVLNKLIDDAFMSLAPQIKDSLTIVLESLTDDKVKTLYGVYMKAIPDHSVTYSSHPIFSQVEPEKFVEGFVKLSNESKAVFIQFVKHHYYQAFYPTNAKDFVHYYEDDLNKLPDIVDGLTLAAEQECLVDKDNILALAEILKQSMEKIKKLVLERGKDEKTERQ